MNLPTNERLASVETKLEFIHELLQEIKNDVREQPSRDEHSELKNRVGEIEKALIGVKIKVFAIAGFIGFISSGLGAFIIQSIFKH